MKRAFTLIELLVVISIVSLLSTVVLSSLNTARDKGRIAGAKQFAANVDHAVSDEAFAMFEFEECSGSSTTDRAQNRIGTMNTGAGWSTLTPFNTGCSANLDGNVGYVSASVTPVTVTTVTYTAWVRPDTQTKPWGGIIETFNGGTIRDMCRLYASTLRPNMRVNQANPEIFANASLPLNVWSHVACVYDGTQGKIYIDGKLDVATTVSAGSRVIDTVEVGRNEQSASWMLRGQVDGAHAFGRALTASEIGKLYASEAPKYKIAIEKHEE